MKFLETVTFFGNPTLVPIDRIKYINITCDGDYRIKIVSDDGDWEECFGDDGDKTLDRYEQIKKIVGAK